MSKFDHLIVLMMENRSFDHMLGFLDHGDPTYERAQGACDDDQGQPVAASTGARYQIASPDHSHVGVMQQLLDGAGGPPTMRGFVKNYARRAGNDGHKVMRSFDPRQLPVLSRLAREYAVCTRWFSSVPGETWPNREFLHSGTSRGLADIVLHEFESTEKTVFELLDDVGASWRIYHDDTPHTWNYPNLWDTLLKRARFQGMDRLYEAIRTDALPSYAFVEPDYGLIGRGNSQHPGQAKSLKEFVAGELLIHRIYDALRTNPAVFEKTVFVIIYDEHGGFYDHVPPPPAKAPDGRKDGSFAFDLLGARIPAVIVSPWIKRGTIDRTVYDHTSVIQTLWSRFTPGGPHLKKRDEIANTFRAVLAESAPRRGADLPTTWPLSAKQAETLEKDLGGAESIVETPAAEVTESFEAAMRELSRHVGEVLARESITEGPESLIDADDPELVLDRFRRSAGGKPTTDRAARHLLGEAVARRLTPRPAGGGEEVFIPGLGDGFESFTDFSSDLRTRFEAIDATPAEKATFETVLPRLANLESMTSLDFDDLKGFEAIIKVEGRFPIDVVDNSFPMPPSPWEFLGQAPARARLEAAIRCVGRIELPGQSSIPYAGTGFLVGPNLIMTNRHVAGIFATGVGRKGLQFKSGGMRVGIDLERDRGSKETHLLDVTDVVMIHPHWDLALLRITGAPEDRFLRLRPIDPAQAKGRNVVAIGYPARDDTRNDPTIQATLFNSVYRFKRLSPGEIMGAGRPVPTDWGTVLDTMTHDCSTLGGNSGSALVDVDTGDVIGLHLGGRFLDANFSCPAFELKRDPRIVEAGVQFTDGDVPAGAPWLAAWSAVEGVASGPRTLAVINNPPLPPDPTSTFAAPPPPPYAAGAPATVKIMVPIEITVSVGAPVVAGGPPVITTVVPATTTTLSGPSKREAVRAYLSSGRELPAAVSTGNESIEEGPVDDQWATEIAARRARLEANPDQELEVYRTFFHDPDLTLDDVRALLANIAESLANPNGFYDALVGQPTEGFISALHTIGKCAKAIAKSDFPPKPASLQQQADVHRLQAAYQLDTDIAINPNDKTFETCDPGWWHLLFEKAEEKMGRWPKGLAPYRPDSPQQPYIYEAQYDARRKVALMADFGTGYYHSRHIARQLQRAAYPYVFHLGDVYYGGEQREFDDFFIPQLDPVAKAGSKLFTLPENHELYGEGVAYLKWLDRARSNGWTPQQGTYWCVRFPEHQFVAIDVNWNGRQRFTHQPSRDWLERVLATSGNRTTIFFTGSAPWSYGSTETTKLYKDLFEKKPNGEGGWLQRGAIDLWFWGDDHYCTLFDAPPTIPVIGSCIGHGGYPGTMRADHKPTFAPARWVETEARFPSDLPLRTDVGNNGWCELTMLAGGGVELLYVDWLSLKRFHIRYLRDAGGRLVEDGAGLRFPRTPGSLYRG